jgi:nitric oxide reductase NorD protein
MYREIPARDKHIRKVVIETPLDDYELLDYGRKLERFGPYVVDRPDKRAAGNRTLREWTADWSFARPGSGSFGWQQARADLPRQWEASIDGMQLHCALDEHGRVGVNIRDIAARRWIRKRLGGCYDIDDMRLLNLFAGSGVLTDAALRAGATVTHVDSTAAMIELSRRNLGERNIRYEQIHVPTFVEGAQLRAERFHFVVASPPRIGKAQHASWDIEVDLARLIRNLPGIVSEHCRGIWVHVDAGSWTTPSIAQMLREALPGRTVETLELAIGTADGRALPAGGVARWYDPQDDQLNVGGRQPFGESGIEEHLDVYLDAVLSSRRTAVAPARQIAELDRAQQDFVLRWVSVIAHTNGEMAYQLASYVSEAFRFMDADGVEAWIVHTMDVYDTVEEVAGVIEAFVHGLNGRKLKVECGAEVYTDTETLFFPAMVNRFKTREENFQFYKAIAVHLWAQCWYGTWREDVNALVAGFDNPDKALTLFHALETLRLDACIRRELPGVSRQLAALRATSVSSLPESWEQAVAQLQERAATVADTATLLAQVVEASVPDAVSYQGVLKPRQVEQVRAVRIKREQDLFRMGLMRMRDELPVTDTEDSESQEAEEETATAASGFELREVESADQPEGFSYEIMFDGKPVAPPDDVKGVMASILQDLGDIPEEYLVAAGAGAYSMAGPRDAQKPEDVWKGTYHEEGAFIYNEWDYERRHYRKNWAVLRELDVSPCFDDFVPRTLVKYRGLAGSLRRTFEALRGEDKLLKKQHCGDNVDIDALVESYADATMGMEMSDRLFTKRHKLDRNMKDYLPHMYGAVNYTVIDEVRKLPLKVSDIYRRLTT